MRACVRPNKRFSGKSVRQIWWDWEANFFLRKVLIDIDWLFDYFFWKGKTLPVKIIQIPHREQFLFFTAAN